MGHLGKTGGRCGADAARRAVGADQLGKVPFDRRVALAQRVIIGVGDLGCRLGVVEPVVPLDLLGKPGELVAGLLYGQRIDRVRVVLRGRCVHARPPAIRLAAAARASAVTMRPDSMRAISSCLVAGSSSSTRVTASLWERRLATRQ